MVQKVNDLFFFSFLAKQQKEKKKQSQNTIMEPGQMVEMFNPTYSEGFGQGGGGARL